MKSIYEILIQFQTDTSTDLPDLLTAVGLSTFDNYIIGASRNSKEKVLCIYKDTFREDAYRRDLTIIFHAQLTGIEEEAGAKYEDVIRDYLKKYKPSEIGMHIIEAIQVETFGLDNNQGIIHYFTIQFSEMLDGCDNE